MGGAVSLRVFEAGDRFVLNRWLGEAHVIAWFGSRAIADAETAMAQSSPSALVRVIERDGQAIGYLHAFDAAMMGGVRAATLTDGVFVMTAIIGSADLRGKGHGAAALALARDELFQTTLAPATAVLVPLAREHAVRSLERQGFRWQEVWRDAALGPCWVLVAERP